jgi:hypothetical protein
MFDFLLHLFPSTPRQKHQEELRDKTHEALNELHHSILAYQHRSRRDRAEIVRILSESEQELNSVAEKIAVATGSSTRRRR